MQLGCTMGSRPDPPDLRRDAAVGIGLVPAIDPKLVAVGLDQEHIGPGDIEESREAELDRFGRTHRVSVAATQCVELVDDPEPDGHDVHSQLHPGARAENLAITAVAKMALHAVCVEAWVQVCVSCCGGIGPGIVSAGSSNISRRSISISREMVVMGTSLGFPSKGFSLTRPMRSIV